MKCQICGKDSGKYPLCKHCYYQEDDGYDDDYDDDDDYEYGTIEFSFCDICGIETDGYDLCKKHYYEMKNGIITRCNRCGQYYYKKFDCLCNIVFIQCENCGRWHDGDNDCICGTKIKKEENKKYKKKNQALTKAESKFLTKLEKVVDLDKYRINIQTSLRQLVEKKQKWAWANELNRDIDFCILDKSNFEVVLCIEYDDSTHDTPERQERDKKVDYIAKEAGLKLLHIRRNDEMAIDYLSGKLKEYL